MSFNTDNLYLKRVVEGTKKHLNIQFKKRFMLFGMLRILGNWFFMLIDSNS